VAGLPVVLPTNSCYQKYEVLDLLTIAWWGYVSCFRKVFSPSRSGYYFY